MNARLFRGYRRFRRRAYRRHAALLGRLARNGQAPRFMVIGCCDSRVEPAVIFDASPGELFVLRNVANLVPPCLAGERREEQFHGAAAALEYAVGHLEVSVILVLGHSHCGGVGAALEAAKAEHDGADKGISGSGPEPDFIGSWVGLLAAAAGACLANGEGDPARALEEAGVRQSLRNLMTYPFVEAAVERGDLAIEGCHFDIAGGSLSWLDPGTGVFETVEGRIYPPESSRPARRPASHRTRMP